MRLENVGKHESYEDKDDLGRKSDAFMCVSVCGYYQIDTYTNTSNRPEGREDYQLLYVTKSKVEIMLNGEKMWLHEGSVLLYRPSEPQWYRYHAKDRPEIYWTHFTGEGIKQLLENLGFGTDNVFHIGKSEKICGYFRELIGELQIKRENYTLNSNRYLLLILSEISSQILPLQDEIKDTRYRDLQSVIEYINHRYSKDTDVEEYAQMCNMSKYHFMRIFKEQMGISPYAYKIKVRIRHAKDFLRHTDLSVAEIGEMLGYADASCFSKQFKKVVGTSPLVYRKNKADDKKEE